MDEFIIAMANIITCCAGFKSHLFPSRKKKYIKINNTRPWTKKKMSFQTFLWSQHFALKHIYKCRCCCCCSLSLSFSSRPIVQWTPYIPVDFIRQNKLWIFRQFLFPCAYLKVQLNFIWLAFEECIKQLMRMESKVYLGWVQECSMTYEFLISCRVYTCVGFQKLSHLCAFSIGIYIYLQKIEITVRLVVFSPV